jgi:hypothetical protein
VSTIAEIEAAIQQLSRQQVEQLAAWLEEFKDRAEKPVEHTDLDSFIGTWVEDEGFEEAMRIFGQVDEELWK